MNLLLKLLLMRCPMMNDGFFEVTKDAAFGTSTKQVKMIALKMILAKLILGYFCYNTVVFLSPIKFPSSFLVKFVEQNTRNYW